MSRISAVAVRLSHIDFTANDWFYPCLSSCDIKVDNAVHSTMVSDGEAMHAQFFGPGNKPRNAAHAIKQAVLGMNVEMSEFLWHF